jgi:hypothetical protein
MRNRHMAPSIAQYAHMAIRTATWHPTAAGKARQGIGYKLLSPALSALL